MFHGITQINRRQNLRCMLAAGRRALAAGANIAARTADHLRLSISLAVLVAFLALASGSPAFGQIYWNGYTDQYVNSIYPGNWDYTTQNWEDGSGNLINYADGQDVIIPLTSQYNNAQQGDPNVYISNINLTATFTPTSVLVHDDNSVDNNTNYTEGYTFIGGGIADSGATHTTLTVTGDSNPGYELNLQNVSLTYTGATTVINSGQIDVTPGSTLGNNSVLIIDSTSSVDLGDNGPANGTTAIVIGGLSDDVGGAGQEGGGQIGDGPLTINVATGQTYTFSGTIGNQFFNPTDASLTVTGGGTQILTGTNYYSAGTTVSGSTTLVINSEGTGVVGTGAPLGLIPLFATPDNVVLDGGTLQATGTFVLNANRGLAISPNIGTIDVTPGSTVTYNGVIADYSGSGILDKTDSGALILGGANTFTGGVNISGGMLQVTNTAGSATGTGPVVIGNSATLKGASSPGAGFINGLVTVNTGGTIAANLGDTLTIAGGLSLAGTSAAQFSVSGPALGSGNLPLINVTGGGLTIAAGTHAVTLSGGVQVGVYDLFQFTGTAPSIAGLTVSGPANYSYSSSVVGGNEIDLTVTSTAPQLTWTGSGSSTWNMANTNWIGASTTFANGDAVTFGNTGAGAVAIGATVTPQFVKFTNTTGTNYTLSGSAIAGANTYLLVAGSGKVTLSSPNSYGAGTTLSGNSTLNISSDTDLGAVPPTPQTNIAFTGSATLQFAASFSGAGALSANRGITVDNGVTAIFDDLGNSVTVAGAITGPGRLIATSSGSAGTLTLSGANSYSGATTVTNNTLALSPGASLGNTAISIGIGATFASQPGSGAVVAGSNVAGTAGATLTLNSASTFSMTDGAAGIFDLQQQTGFGAANTALTISGATLNFDVGAAADGLRVNVGKAAISGTNTIGITPLSNLAPAINPIVAAPGGLLARVSVQRRQPIADTDGRRHAVHGESD